MVGQITHQRTGSAVTDVVDGHGHGQQRQGDTQAGDRNLVQTVVTGNRTERSRRHDTAGGNTHEADVDQPEQGFSDDLCRIVVFLGRNNTWNCFRSGWQFGTWHEQCTAGNDDTLNNTEDEERLFIARGIDHVGDRNNGNSSTATETGCRRTRCQTPFVREPFQRVTGTGTVHGTGAGTGQDLGEIQNTQAGSLGTDNPADGNQNSTENNDRTRAELVNAPSFQRNQPGFEKQEDGERQLNGCTGPVIFIFNRSNEQCPAVLAVRDRCHTDNT